MGEGAEGEAFVKRFWEFVRDDQDVGKPELTPEKEMLVAMVFRAAQDLHLTNEEDAEDAALWLSQREWHSDELGWSFPAVCQFLDLAEDAAREAIYRMPKGFFGKGVAVRRIDPKHRRK